MADYVKTDWTTGDTITEALADHWETQYDVAKAELEAGAWALYFSGAVSTNRGLGIEVSGDTYDRFRVLASGKCEWGTGSATQDVNLYRGGANQLKTDDTMYAVGGMRCDGTLDLNGNLDFDGSYIYIGSDCNLYRGGADVLKTDDDFVCGDLDGTNIEASGYLKSSNYVYLGSDCSFYRFAANNIKTDDKLTVNGDIDAGINSIEAANISANTSMDVQGNLGFGNGALTDVYLSRGSANVLKLASGDTMEADYFQQSTPLVARAYRSSNQTVNHDTNTIVQFSSESFDPGSDYDTSNYRYVAPVDGYYRVSVNLRRAGLGDGKYSIASIYVGAVEKSTHTVFDGSSSENVVNHAFDDILDLSAGNYVYVYYYHNKGSSSSVYSNSYATFELITKK